VPARTAPFIRTALAIAATAGLAACSTRVDGTPEEQPTGPLTQVLGEADIEEAVGSAPFPIDVVAHPDGHLTALIGPRDRTSTVDTFLVDVVPGEDGPEASNVRPLPTLDWSAELHLTDDGTVVVAGLVGKGVERGPRILVMRPGADEPEIIDPDLDADYLESTLSLDGSTLYVNPTVDTTEPQDPQLLAVDIATGETTGSVDLPPGGEAQDMATTADGTVTALIAIRTPDGAHSSRLVTYDADLEQLSDTELYPPDDSYAAALTVAADGTAVVTVNAGQWDDRVATVFLVTDGEVTELATLDEAQQAPDGVAVDAAGEYAYLPYETRDGDAVVSVVETATGQVTDVELCDDGFGFDAIALATDGATLATLGSCDTTRDLVILLGRG
jgi:hypothetical protein